MNNFIAIPEWLRGTPEYHIFCTHRNKVPTHNTHVDDMSTYHTFTEALALMDKDEGLGIGMFGNLCGVDIDHCIENNIISPEAQAIIDYFDGAYIEKSFSGTGVHILFFHKEQHKYQKYYTKMNKKHLEDKGIKGIEGLEFYQGQIDNRYLTLTGNIIPPKNPHGYTFNEKKILSFLDKYFIKDDPTPVAPITISSNDKEDIAWFVFGKSHSPKLTELASKIPTGSGGTESEDDLALMSEIAFYANNNPIVMRKAFESSFYYKHKDAKHIKKWARKDYSEGVISKAMSQNTAKEYFTDSYYDQTQNKIIQKGGESTMVAPSISTRISKAGQELVVIDTKQFKFEASKPELKKNSEERTVRWVSVYKKGSNEPSKFLDRNTPEFELAAGIVLEKF